MAGTIYLRYVLNTRKLKEFEHEPAPVLFGDREKSWSRLPANCGFR